MKIFLILDKLINILKDVIPQRFSLLKIRKIFDKLLCSIEFILINFGFNNIRMVINNDFNFFNLLFDLINILKQFIQLSPCIVSVSIAIFLQRCFFKVIFNHFFQFISLLLQLVLISLLSKRFLNHCDFIVELFLNFVCILNSLKCFFASLLKPFGIHS